MAIPLYLQTVGVTFIAIIQSSILSHYLDSFFVIPTTISNQVLNVVTYIIAISSGGVSILLSIILGRGDKDSEGKVIANSFFLSITISAICCFIMIIFATRILSLVGMNGESYAEQFPYALKYFYLKAIIIFLFQWVETFVAVLCCYGYTKISFIAKIAQNLSNALFLYVGIYIIKIPKDSIIYYISGVEGFSFIVEFLILFVFFKKKKLPFEFNISKKFLLQLLKIGFPASIAMICYTLSLVITSKIVLSISPSAYNARYYISQISVIIHGLGYAVGQASAIFLGRLCGMGDYGKASKTYYNNLKIAILCNLFFSVLFLLLSKVIMRYVFNADSDIMVYVLPIFAINIVVEIFRAFNHIGQFGLNATGDVVYTSIIAIIGCFVCSVGLSYIFVILLNMNLYGIWLASLIDEATRGMLYFVRWKKGKWKNIQIKN